MYLKKATRSYTGGCLSQTARLKAELQEADAVVTGAGAGLSAAAGFAYDGERFHRHFADFEAAYGFHDMYTGGFYPYNTPEEFWAFWSRSILLNRYSPIPGPAYRHLKKALEGKDYFIITTNVDHCFQKTGFDKKRLFYTQGDYGLWQCARPCHAKTYDNEKAVRLMAKRQAGLRIPSELLPHCPVCGGPMTMNLRCDASFVEDAGWRAARKRYEAFLRAHAGRRILFLELGVGGNTPAIIKYPFWRLTAENPRAVYACVNVAPSLPPRLKERAFCVREDLAPVLARLAEK